MAERVLLIEDDPELGAQIVEHLRLAGFAPLWWKEGRPLTPEEAETIALVILDLNLPGSDGLAILQALRAHAEVPVLVLSARSATSDKVGAMRLGADDYMTKPFWDEELIERVRARVRRPNLRRADTLTVGPLFIDVEKRVARMHGEALELTRVEFELLLALARRPGFALTRKWLTQHVLDPEQGGGERTLDVHVSRLRRKLGPAHNLETVWGIGYRLTDREDR